jgi:hypothetical protein
MSIKEKIENQNFSIRKVPRVLHMNTEEIFSIKKKAKILTIKSSWYFHGKLIIFGKQFLEFIFKVIEINF